MFNFACFVIILLIGFINVNSMSIKRSEKSANNLEKVDETEYPIKVNYDVYPVSQKSHFGPPVALFLFNMNSSRFWLSKFFPCCATGQKVCVGKFCTT